MTPSGPRIQASDINAELFRNWNASFSMNDWMTRALNGTRDGGITYMSNSRSKDLVSMWLVAGNPDPANPPPGYYSNNFGPSIGGWDNGDYNGAFGSSSDHWFRGNRVFRVIYDKAYARVFVDIFGNIPQASLAYIHIFDGNGNLVYARAANQLNWYEYIPNGYGYTRFGWDWGSFGFTTGWGYTVHLYG